MFSENLFLFQSANRFCTNLKSHTQDTFNLINRICNVVNKLHHFCWLFQTVKISICKAAQSWRTGSFFLPHGLKLPPPLSQAIFAINSPLWFNFAFLSWNIIVKCELNFSAILFTHIPESFFEIQICISVWNENLRGTGVETKLASLKGFYTGGLPPLKRRFVIPAGLVLVAIIWPTRAWYRP